MNILIALILLVAGLVAAQAQTAPAQMGITPATVPEVLQVLDKNQTWVPIGNVDPATHTFVSTATAAVAFTTQQIPSQRTPSTCFRTSGYAQSGDGGGAVFCADPTGYPRFFSTISDGVTTAGSPVLSSGTTDASGQPIAGFNILDAGRPVSGAGIPAGTTIVGPMSELSGPPIIPALTGTGAGYKVGHWRGIISSGTLTVSTVYDGQLAPGQEVWMGGVVLPRPTIVSQLSGTPGGVGTYSLSRAVSSALNDAWSGDLITLNDGCFVNTILVARLVTPSGVLLSAGVDLPGECLTEPANPVGVSSTSGTGSGASFTLTWWPSAVYAKMSQPATATATNVSFTLGPHPQSDPGYAVDAVGVGVALAQQPMHPKMFGAAQYPQYLASPTPASSCTAFRTMFAAQYNTGWPLAQIAERYMSDCQLYVVWPLGSSQFIWQGSNMNWNGIRFSGTLPAPLMKFSIPAAGAPLVQASGAAHASFGQIVTNLRFDGTAVGGATLQFGENIYGDAMNNPWLMVNGINNSKDPFAVGVRVNGLFACYNCVFNSGNASQPGAGSNGAGILNVDGSTTAGSPQFCSPSTPFDWSWIGQELSTVRTPASPGPQYGAVPGMSFIIDAPPDTPAGCVTLNQNATGTQSNQSFNVSAGLAGVLYQRGNFATVSGISGGSPQAHMLLRSWGAAGTRNFTFVTPTTNGMGIEGMRFEDTTTQSNSVYGGYFADDYAINAMAGTYNFIAATTVTQTSVEQFWLRQFGASSDQVDGVSGGPNNRIIDAASLTAGAYATGVNNVLPVPTTSGTGQLYGGATTGATLRGLGSPYDVQIRSNSSAAISIPTGTSNALFSGTIYGFSGIGTAGNNLFIQNTQPTVASGFGASPTISGNGNTTAFNINISSSPQSSGVLTFPAAAHGWNCSFNDITNPGANFTKESAATTTSVTVTNYNSSGTPTNWGTNDQIRAQCMGY